MDAAPVIACARPDEWADALALALREVPEDERAARVRKALALVGSGEIDAQGIFVARSPQRIVGVQVCIPLRGASGLFWLPQVDGAWATSDLAQRLVQAALIWVRGRGAKLAQALLHPDHLDHAGPLLSRGFRNVTQLQYMRHDLEEIPTLLDSPSLELQVFSAANASDFQDTLLRTYEGTLDCPELNGIRTVEEAVEGHRAQGIWRPENWRLARLEAAPVGVLLMTELFEGNGWDLSYVGVRPEFRGRGLGRMLTIHALTIVWKTRARQLLLAVDRRNAPALSLYESLGFMAMERREVLLHLNLAELPIED